MKTKILFPILALAALALLLGGCATGLTASSWPGVAADGEYAFVAGGAYVYAVNLQTGVEAWRFPEKASAANPFQAPPVLTENGQLLVGGYDHKLYSLDPATGAEIWVFAEARDRWIGSVLVANELIFAPNADYNLYALDMNGNRQWAFDAKQSIWGTPVSDGENVYFGTLGSKFFALKAGTGNLVWETELTGAVLGSPVLTDGVLYVGLFSGDMVALDARDGSLLWSQPTGSWIWSGPVLSGSTLYFGNGAGDFAAMDLHGNVLWNEELSGAITGAPLLNGDTLVIGTESGNIYYINTDGTDLRPVSVSGKVYSTLVISGDMLLVGLTENEDKAILTALDPNGAILWTFLPEK